MKMAIIIAVKLLVMFVLFEFIILWPVKTASRLYITGGRVTKAIAIISGFIGAGLWLALAWFVLGRIERWVLR
jgi:hypothetical protein